MTVACLGITVLDHVFDVASLPLPLGKNPASGHRSVIGGIAANAALAIARLGGDARLISRVGNDETGRNLCEILHKYGVDTTEISTLTDASTSISAVLVDPAGERVLVNHKETSLFADGDIPESALRGCTVLLCDLRWPAGAIAAMTYAKTAGITRVLDYDIAPEDGADDLAALATHAIYSEAALCRRYDADLLPALDCAAREAPFVAVTCGGDGTHWRAKGSSGHIAAHAVKTRDTLGAGDVFHGAAALALSEGLDFVAALHFANAAAAIKITRPSGPENLPTRADLAPLLEHAT